MLLRSLSCGRGAIGYSRLEWLFNEIIKASQTENEIAPVVEGMLFIPQTLEEYYLTVYRENAVHF